MCIKSNLRNVVILFFCVISMITSYSISSDAQTAHVDTDDFVVRVIYFKPIGSAPLEEKIVDKMGKAQQFYADEMVRHGFEPKTFRLARNESGSVKIHIVNAQRPALEYVSDTKNKVLNELPSDLKDTNSINVIFVGGIDFMKPEFGFRMAGMGWYHGTGGGVIVVANQILLAEEFQMALKNHTTGIFFGSKMLPIIVHELGHAFGLYHNETTPKSVMSHNLGPPHLQNVGVDLFFDKFESRWFNNHYYFNSGFFVDTSALFTGETTYHLIRMGDTDFVEFNLNILSRNQLHQAQLVDMWEANLLSWQTFRDDCDSQSSPVHKVKFLVERNLLNNTPRLRISALDVKGNHILAEINFNAQSLEENVVGAPSKPKVALATKWANLKR